MVASGRALAAAVVAALAPTQAALTLVLGQARELASPPVGVVQAVGAAGSDPLDDLSENFRNATGDGKMLMDPTEIFRMMMCWGRPKLLEHEKCMDFMAAVCRGGTTGQGFCRRTREWAAARCDSTKGERACHFASRMGADVHVTASLEGPSPEALEGNTTSGDNGTLGGNATLAPPNGTQEPPEAAPAQVKDGLPEQGFDEYSNTSVRHVDMESGTGDWGAEWPMRDETEGQSTARICREQPGHPWCKLYLRDRERRKRGPRVPPLDAPGAPPRVVVPSRPWAV